MKDTISPAQLRAARGLINWSREELALRAGTTERTVARIELKEGASKPATLTAIRTALEAAGVIFIDKNGEGPGVRLSKYAWQPFDCIPANEEVEVQDENGAVFRYTLWEDAQGHTKHVEKHGVPVQWRPIRK